MEIFVGLPILVGDAVYEKYIVLKMPSAVPSQRSGRYIFRHHQCSITLGHIIYYLAHAPPIKIMTTWYSVFVFEHNNKIPLKLAPIKHNGEHLHNNVFAHSTKL